MSLLEDLREAEGALTRAGLTDTCLLCEYIRATEDEETREALTACAAGTIGRDKLAAILKRQATGIGKRTIIRHREEGHTP